MKKIMNDADFVADDMIEGFLKAHPTIAQSMNNDRVVFRKNKDIKVGLVSGGGSGHEPCFLGYVGKHMLDAVAVGEVFSSPPATAFLEAIRCADSGQGVLCLIGNYAGDRMNILNAIEKAKEEGINAEVVFAKDDIASQPFETKDNRHGIAGGPLLWNLVGLYCEQGASLSEATAFAETVASNTLSLTVGLSSCTIPALGKPNFDVKDDEMIIGLGHHGEKGIHSYSLEPSEEIAQRITSLLHEEMTHDEVIVMVSGMGGTPLMEQYILNNDVIQAFDAKNIHVFKSYVGNFVTSLEMQGACVTILQTNPQIKTLIDHEPNFLKTGL